MTMQPQQAPKSNGALSKENAFSFLNGNNKAATDLISTPLEQEASRVKSFADYTTGTIELTITPEMVSATESLREMSLSTDFKRLATFVQTLQADFPRQNNLLVAMLNPTWLASHVPFCETPQDVTEDMIKRSTWNLQLTNDYALIEGVPVWDRLEGERVDFFNVFKLYRDSRYGLIDSGDYTLCSRSMAGLARRLQLAPQLLSTIANIYNWQLRCAYYDKFFEMDLMRRKQLEVQLLQRDHLKFSTTLIDKAMSYLDKHPNALTPKDAIAMVELGFKFSRLSLGLAPDKAGHPSGVESQPLLAIQFNQNNQDNKLVQLNDNRSYGSEVERKLGEELKDTDNLLSILHVLQKSGAMATALQDKLLPDKSTSYEVVETVPDAAIVSADKNAGNKKPIIIEPAIQTPAAFEEGIQ